NCITLLFHEQNLKVFSSKPTKVRKSAKKPRSHTGSKSVSSGVNTTRTDVDILSPAAMENLYYVSHNVMDCLKFRGFGWSGFTQKDKKGTKSKIKNSR
ncbi:small lysine-rich protein 1, partial [Thalassophryne amazonica]|uniref:small lysine-rich protein 1 n=1 Tax=Thalassophryne amazonica TaxID=390379 RepID=UPI0014721E48